MCYMANRSKVGVREIRQNLSVYLDRVKEGEALEITERGYPVAILGPLPGRTTTVERLVAEGRATAPSADKASLGSPLRLKMRQSLSHVLDDLREDRV